MTSTFKIGLIISMATLLAVVVFSDNKQSLGLVPNGKRAVTPVPANLLALVPKPEGTNEIVKKRNADPIRHTVPLILKLSKRQKWQGKKLAAALTGKSLQETVRNDYDFIFNHIQYQEDPEDVETIRSLRRLIYDGAGDCDCFTNALSNLLQNQNIAHKLKVTAPPGRSDWGHIYIIVPTGSGNYITLDPVVHEYDTEAPYSKSILFNV
jgi:hypothetical protein